MCARQRIVVSKSDSAGRQGGGAKRPPKVLAIASGGGHWIELLRLRPAFEGAEVAYVTVRSFYRDDVSGSVFYCVPDANRWNRLKLVWLVFRLLLILLRERPDVIITTGAAPGLLAIRLGRLLKIRGCWVDSFANVDQLSLSGRLAVGHAALCLTQWPHLANAEEGIEYAGSVF